MDSTQAIYDAIRSKISNGNIGDAVRDVASERFDISFAVDMVRTSFQYAAQEMQRPFYLLRPSVYPDGNMWCALYGADLQEGVAGFGETPSKAAWDFDKQWAEAKAPSAKPAAPGLSTTFLIGLLQEVIAACEHGEPPFEHEHTCCLCDNCQSPKDTYDGLCLYHEITEAIEHSTYHTAAGGMVG